MKNTLLKWMLLCGCAVTTLFFTACKKDVLSPALPNAVQDTLKGKEFIFKDLTWKLDDSGFPSLQTPVRHDLFRFDYINAVVSVKFDTSNDWIAVDPLLRAFEDTPPYLYFIDISSGVCIIRNYTFLNDIIGQKAAVKVKFL